MDAADHDPTLLNWSHQPGLVPLVTRYPCPHTDSSCNVQDDILLTGPTWWQSVPVLLNYERQNQPWLIHNTHTPKGADLGEFADIILSGDFDGDAVGDVMHIMRNANPTGQHGIHLMYGGTNKPGGVGYTHGEFEHCDQVYRYWPGTFVHRKRSCPDLRSWMGLVSNHWIRDPMVDAIAGDFDGDGDADVALTGGMGWGSIPVAFSRSDSYIPQVSLGGATAR